MAKAWACQGSAKTGSSAPGGRRGSGALKVAFPGVDADGRGGIGVRAPELGRGEDDGVQVLRVLALEVGVGIGEDVAAVQGLDGAELAARIAGKPRVVRGVD